jgi:hypothetical protein
MSDRDLTAEELANVAGAGPKPGTSDPRTAADKYVKAQKDEVDKAQLTGLSGGATSDTGPSIYPDRGDGKKGARVATKFGVDPSVGTEPAGGVTER